MQLCTGVLMSADVCTGAVGVAQHTGKPCNCMSAGLVLCKVILASLTLLVHYKLRTFWTVITFGNSQYRYLTPAAVTWSRWAAAVVPDDHQLLSQYWYDFSTEACQLCASGPAESVGPANRRLLYVARPLGRRPGWQI